VKACVIRNLWMNKKGIKRIGCASTHAPPSPSFFFSNRMQAGHQLKGLGAVVSCLKVSGLHVPLMCIVDYKYVQILPMIPIGIYGIFSLNQNSTYVKYWYS
jgi:hypothetical protein